MFDADEYLEALNPPVFKYGGRTYRGRILSEEEFLRFAPQLQAVARKKISYLEYRVLVWQIGRAIFPKPWWKVWERSVGSILLKLPAKVREAALRDFLEPQGAAMGLQASPTPGSASPPAAGEAPRRKRKGGRPSGTGSPDSSGSTDPTSTTPRSGRRATG